MLFRPYKRARDTLNDSVVLQENLETIHAVTQEEYVNFVHLSGSRMSFEGVRKPSFKCIAACFRAWTGMWASSSQEGVPTAEFRSTLE